MKPRASIYTVPEEAELLAGPALSSPFPFTLFPDTKARTKRGKRADLIALAKRVERTTAAEKSVLPLVSLGRYGDLKSERGSLRHQRNLREVHGLEADYDAGEMPPTEAARRLSEAHVAALIYTSPSHGLPGKGHRWRVVCPFSGRVPPEERERHVARLNGILGGVLSRESFTLSQSFFIGGIGGREPKTFLVDGVHIDGRADLDAGAVHARTSEPVEKVSPPGDWPLETIRDALFAVPPDADYETWWRCLAAVHHETGGSKRGFAIAEAWSACGDKWKTGDVRAKWRSFGDRDGTLAAAGTLFRHAHENGWEGPTEDFGDDFDTLPDDDDPDAEIARILGFDETPEQKSTGGLVWRTPDQCRVSAGTDYAVKRFINKGQVGLIYGSPGHGKSMIAPAIGYAIAQGRVTFGLRTKAGPMFYFASEDPLGLERRVRALEAEHGAAPDFQLVGNVQGLFEKGAADLKELLREVRKQQPRLVIIDTLAAAFPGLEENAAESMGRVVRIARKIAATGTAVIMVHHTPHAAKNPRGHSVLNGDVDMALLLEMDEGAGVIRGEMKKNRNGPLLNVAFTIGVKELGADEDGDPITAGFCEEMTESGERSGPRLPPQQRKLMKLFQSLAGRSETVEREALKEAAIADTSIFLSDAPRNRRTQFNRALNGLLETGRLFQTGDAIGQAPARVEVDVEYDFDDLDSGDADA
ncbi:MAG: AAA family ATPase [Paracoccaceae bacterium]|nr:AAA family ATPase [Paracoccaceae bacterium]